MDKLPPDLKQYVMEDNELLDKEIEDWDTLQAHKAQQEKLALASAAAALMAASSTSASSSSPQPMSTESSPPDNAGTGHSEPQTRALNTRCCCSLEIYSITVYIRCYYIHCLKNPSISRSVVYAAGFKVCEQSSNLQSRKYDIGFLI